MKKFVYATLAAATLFATIGAASAQENRHWQEVSLALNTGGASAGYNYNLQTLDNVK